MEQGTKCSKNGGLEIKKEEMKEGNLETVCIQVSHCHIFDGNGSSNLWYVQ